MKLPPLPCAVLLFFNHEPNRTKPRTKNQPVPRKQNQTQPNRPHHVLYFMFPIPLYILHILYFTLYTLHSTLTLCITLHSPLHTLHSLYSLYTWCFHPILHSLHSPFLTSDSTHRILHSTLHFLHLALHPFPHSTVHWHRNAGKIYKTLQLFFAEVFSRLRSVRGLLLAFLEYQ